MAGVIAIDTRVGGVIVSVVLPVTAPELAEMVVLPTAKPLASPAEMLAIAGDEELHIAELVRLCVDPSL